jgi:cell division septation protein DedD
MLMMVTVRTVKVFCSALLLVLASGCSREQQDWRSAEAADSMKAYGQFIERHPDSELATQARTRVAQLGEDQDWQSAALAGTSDAYRQFLTQHPSGKWAQEAHIRIESFALGAQSTTQQTGPQQTGSQTAPRSPLPMDARGSAVAVPEAPPRVIPAVEAQTGRGAEEALPGDGPPSTAAAPGAAPATIGAGYGVQLGAFTSEAAANNQWRTLSTRFGPELGFLSPHVVSASTGSGTVYRLQAGVEGEPQARALCGTLKQQGQGCVPVLPR